MKNMRQTIMIRRVCFFLQFGYNVSEMQNVENFNEIRKTEEKKCKNMTNKLTAFNIKKKYMIIEVKSFSFNFF